MYAGEIVESGTLEDIFVRAVHPYTKGLFGSIPDLDEDRERLQPITGLMPDQSNLPEGCNFAPRCPSYTDRCKDEAVAEVRLSETHTARCRLLNGTNEGKP